jgi:hypothetical protein
MSLQLAADLEAERAQLHRHWQQRLERAQYQVERAARQYQAVEPLCGLHSNVTPRI